MKALVAAACGLAVDDGVECRGVRDVGVSDQVDCV